MACREKEGFLDARQVLLGCGWQQIGGHIVEHAQIAGGLSGQGSDKLRGHQMRATGLIQGEDQILLEQFGRQTGAIRVAGGRYGCPAAEVRRCESVQAAGRRRTVW
jgi:hypothetical protein